ncbi:MAG: phenylalanine--tRNA ligase beta subunit-related protein [Candidatus Bathyarchaeota archaeon]|nr:phenylalanine--tRNA ligase beta subunit-related protein [Candidatus Bathyarchaeota archaeon]MDH5687021.1 phenylalanine--tRNA ligase beta subunit-related protein [Candidatus Bathyarchaeota archaeon]
MSLTIDPPLVNLFPDLHVLVGRVENVTVRSHVAELEAFKGEVIEEIRGSYSRETVKDNLTFRAYRDFFWKIKVDPTKTRPAAEALIRRVLRGRPLPKINSLVDAYNLASMKSEIAFAAFDADELGDSLLMRFACEGEEFLGIGMAKLVHLTGSEVVIADNGKLVAIYPYRDAEEAKITQKTRNVLFIACGVPGIDEEKLRLALDLSFKFVTRFCGGTARTM